MRRPEPCTLETPRVRLEPMAAEHADALQAAARDGALWTLALPALFRAIDRPR
jgi:hypothetical protein